jgi:hypothetical protein
MACCVADRLQDYTVVDQYPEVFGMPALSAQRKLIRGFHALTTIAMFASIPPALLAL